MSGEPVTPAFVLGIALASLVVLLLGVLVRSAGLRLRARRGRHRQLRALQVWAREDHQAERPR